MGVISTYGELKTAITDYTGRGGLAAFAANLPTFVMSAHTRLMRELRIPLLQKTATVTINAERVAVPSDFRAVARLSIDADADSPLAPTSLENRLALATRYAPQRPWAFAVEGNDTGEVFAFGPIPDATYTGRLLYWRELPFFASDAATNRLLTKYPLAYLWGALAEASRFDKFVEEVVQYEAMFAVEVGQIEMAEARDATAGGVLSPLPNTLVTP